LKNLEPDATVIHIVRDPREVIRSAINHGSTSGARQLANKLIPYWFPDVSKVIPTESRWSQVAKFAGQWRVVNQMLAEVGRDNPHYHQFRYEDIFDTQGSGLQQICSILNLQYPSDSALISPAQRINRSTKSIISGWEDWSSVVCKQVHAICAELAYEYGYCKEPEWLKRVA
jgi:hypothetical protein